MKKLVVLILALASLTASAQRRGDRDGSITLSDGRSIVRIDVGDERDEREMLRRVRRLEQAVRDLQDKVYQLQAAPARRSYFVCTGSFFVSGILTERGNTETEARAALAQRCQNRVHAMHCDANGSSNNVRCERGEE
jgi:hypothetical protein